jgi:predicted acylesterase/phospholipase RssA
MTEEDRAPGAPAPVRIGLALGGGFARGIAHAGVLRIFDQHHIPIHCITGISAGSIVAAAYASGATPEEIARAGCSMRFRDVGRWSLWPFPEMARCSTPFAPVAPIPDCFNPCATGGSSWWTAP